MARWNGSTSCGGPAPPRSNSMTDVSLANVMVSTQYVRSPLRHHIGSLADIGYVVQESLPTMAACDRATPSIQAFSRLLPYRRRACRPGRGGLRRCCRHRRRSSRCGRFLRGRFLGSRLFGGASGRELGDHRVGSKTGSLTGRLNHIQPFRFRRVAVECKRHGERRFDRQCKRAGRTACLTVGRFGFGTRWLQLEAHGVQHRTGL